MGSANLLAVDLFSGGGGLSQGLEMAGFDVKLAVELGIDQCMTYMENHPGIPVLCRPIQEIPDFRFVVDRAATEGNRIDLVAGGPPCQGFSKANTRNRGEQNSHSKLVWEFHRAVKQIKPRAFLMENVVGIQSIGDGELVSNLIGSFEKLGYEITCMKLMASEFGVPQNRERFFLVGSKEGKIDKPRASHGEDCRKPLVTVKDAILGDLPELGSSTGARHMTYSSRPKSNYQEWASKGSLELYDHVTTKVGEEVKERLRLIEQGSNLKSLMEKDGLPENLKIRIDHAGVYHRLHPDLPSCTIVNLRKAMIIHPTEDRLLTLREAARLQSFRDSYRFRGKLSFMQQVIGDCVPPLLAGCVAKQISKQLAC